MFAQAARRCARNAGRAKPVPGRTHIVFPTAIACGIACSNAGVSIDVEQNVEHDVEQEVKLEVGCGASQAVSGGWYLPSARRKPGRPSK